MLRFFTTFVVIITLISLQVDLSCQVDLTMKIFAKGHDVVAKVVAKLDGSAIFSQQDNGFLHRIAYQMTHDGENPDTYTNNYFGGIWQVDEVNFLATQNVRAYPKLVSLHNKIWEKFGINWTASTQWKDLRIPFYSGIAARLYIETFPRPIPATLQEQADYWYQNYKTKGEKGTAQLFIENSRRHEKEYKCVAKRDICFILDSSGSIGIANYNKALDFLTQVVDSMVIGRNETHVSMVIFSTNPELSFADLYNNASVKAAILHVPYIAASTHTGLAMNFAMDRIYAPFFRKNVSGILPVFMVLTDGQSQDDVKAPAKRIAAKGITAISVGIGDQVNNEQLLDITNRIPENVFLSSFQYLDEILKLLQDSTCSTPAELIIDDEPIEFDLGPAQSTYVRVGLPPEGVTVNVDLEMGQVSAFVSYTEQTPNSAVYDEIVTPGHPKYFPFSKKSSRAAAQNATLYVGFTTSESSEKNVFKLGVLSGQHDAAANLAPNFILLTIAFSIVAILIK